MRRKPRGNSVSRAVLRVFHWFWTFSIPTTLTSDSCCQCSSSLGKNNATSKGLFSMPVSHSNPVPAPTDPVLIFLVNVDENATFRHPAARASIVPPGD